MHHFELQDYKQQELAPEVERILSGVYDEGFAGHVYQDEKCVSVKLYGSNVTFFKGMSGTDPYIISSLPHNLIEKRYTLKEALEALFKMHTEILSRKPVE